MEGQDHPDDRGGLTSMIVDRHEPMNLFQLVPRLCTGLDPALREVDRLLDDDFLFQRVKADLIRRAPIRRPGDATPPLSR